MRQIVIVGGGFAGVWAALAASNARRMYGGLRDVGITVVSRDPWLTIRPRLYEETLDDVRVRLDDVLGPSEVERIEGDVSGIDSNAGAITIGRGGTAQILSYDRLVLAAGSRTHRPPILGADLALTVDSYADAARLQSHLDELVAAPRADGHFTAVVVGAGFTGIEVATALATRMRAAATLAGSNDPSRVVVVERAPSVAPDLGSEARRWVERAFAELGIEVRVGVGVHDIREEGVTLDNANWIPSRTVVWTGGFRASDLTAHLPVDRDSAGRVSVDDALRVRGMRAMFAAGDVARAIADRHGEHIAPMSCQYAIPMGEVAGHNAVAELLGATVRPFSPSAYVTCLDLGEAGALFMKGWQRAVTLTGFWAKVMKQTINTRLIYPTRTVSEAGDRRTAA